jgi:hypothetical protein
MPSTTHMAWQTFFAVLLFLDNTVLSLILLLDNLGFARDEVRIMTDESSPWNLPTKENIVSFAF